MNITELQQTIQQIYTKNIELLKNNYQELYDQIVAFENTQQENWFIDIVEGHLDLVDSKGEALYNCDPFYDANHRTKQLSNQSVFNLIELEIFKQASSKFDIEAYTFVNQFIEIAKKSKLENKYLPKKFIFIGTLLGVHLNDLHKVVQASDYLVIEPNIEKFRLSLMLTDYTELFNSSNLFFAIYNTQYQLEFKVKEFLHSDFIYNHRIGFELASVNEVDLIENLTEIFIQNSEYKYPFSEYLITLKRGMHCIREKYNILNLSVQQDILNDKPILFLGAGPSLGKNIELIKKLQKYLYIVAVAATLKRLEKTEIVPDVIITADGLIRPLKVQFDVDEKYYKDSMILASTKTPSEILTLFDKDQVFLFQNAIEVFSNKGLFNGVSVGDIGYSLLLQLGAKTIYMLGIDAALDPNTGETHDNIHYSNKSYQLENKNILETNGIDYENDTIAVKGNLRDTVYTKYVFKAMIDNFEFMNQNLSDEYTVYNLSDGAYLFKTIPLNPEKLDDSKFTIFDKNEINNKVQKSLTAISSHSLSDIDLVIVNHEKTIIATLEQSEHLQTKVFELLKEYEYSLVLQIFIKYYKLINPYYDYLKGSVDKNKLLKIQNQQENQILEEFKKIYLKF